MKEENWKDWTGETGETPQERTVLAYNECKRQIDQLIEEYGEDMVVYVVNRLL